jgi:hypothetical protein
MIRYPNKRPGIISEWITGKRGARIRTKLTSREAAVLKAAAGSMLTC